jgi:hypothetical protein
MTILEMIIVHHQSILVLHFTITMTVEALTDDNVPFLARLWIGIYKRARPQVNFTGTEVNIGFGIASFCFFVLVRIFVVKVLVDNGWSHSDITWHISSNLTGGIFHSPLLVPISFVLMLNAPYNPSSHMKDHPLWWQEATTAVLLYCAAYFVQDTVVDLVSLGVLGAELSKDTLVFLIHHLISIFYLISSLWLQAGQLSLLMIICFGECTNPIFNMYLACQHAKNEGYCNDSPFHEFIVALEMLTCITYVPVRVILCPLIGLPMSYSLIFSKSAKLNLPLPIRLLWVAMIWATLLGSIPFAVSLVDVMKGHIRGHATRSISGRQEL